MMKKPCHYKIIFLFLFLSTPSLTFACGESFHHCDSDDDCCSDFYCSKRTKQCLERAGKVEKDFGEATEATLEAIDPADHEEMPIDFQP